MTGADQEKHKGVHQVKTWHLVSGLVLVLVFMFCHVGHRNIEEILGFGAEYDALNDGNCELLVTQDGPFSSEDFAQFQDGLYFVSAGDLGKLFGEVHEDRKIKEGKIWVVDATKKATKKMQIVKIDGLPARSLIGFQPHGLYFSHESNTLYAVSHGGEIGGEKVFTFGVVRTGKHGVDSVKLKFERAMSTEEYAPLHGVFNDVVEGTKKGEFYMTQFVPEPLPKNGRPETFEEHINHAAMMVSLFFAKRTTVHRCTFDPKKKSLDNEDVACEVVADGFALANGITANDQRDTYWVADGRKVHQLKREKDGKLTRVDVFSTPHLGDNIEFDSKTGDLVIGCLPNPLKAFERMGKGLSNEGSLHIVHRVNGKMSHSEDVFFHKGNVLGSVSVGALFENKIVLGSPFHSGVLMCEV